MKFFDLDRIKNLSMEDVLSKLNYTVKTKGRSKVMLCPFHDDHHPSMVVYDHAVKCFACGAYYGIIDIVKEKEKCDFMGACKWLDEKFGPLTPEGGSLPDKKKSPLTPEGGSLPVHKAKKKRTLDDYQKMIDRMSLPRVRMEPSPSGERGEGLPGAVFTLDYVRQHLDNGLGIASSSSGIYSPPYREGSGGGSSFYKCLRHLFDA